VVFRAQEYGQADLEFAAAGYRVQYSSCFRLFPLIAAARLLQAGRGRSGDPARPNKFVNALLMQIYASERLLIGCLVLSCGVLPPRCRWRASADPLPDAD